MYWLPGRQPQNAENSREKHSGPIFQAVSGVPLISAGFEIFSPHGARPHISTDMSSDDIEASFFDSRRPTRDRLFGRTLPLRQAAALLRPCNPRVHGYLRPQAWEIYRCDGQFPFLACAAALHRASRAEGFGSGAAGIHGSKAVSADTVKLTWKQSKPRVYWCYRDGEQKGLVFGAPPPMTLWHYSAWPGGPVVSGLATSFREAKNSVEAALKPKV